MSRCILDSTYLSLVQEPLADHSALLPLLFLFIWGFSCFPPLRLKPLCPGPYQALIKTSHSFHWGFQSTRPSFKVAPHLFLEPTLFFLFLLSSRRTSNGLQACSWFLSSSSPLGFSSFLPLLLPRCDKLHSSHSRLFRSRPQLLAWDHTGLTFRLPLFPWFYCFSAHSRAVSPFAFAHPHFFIASNKLLRSASKFSLFLRLLWEACHTFSATSFDLASSTSFAARNLSTLYKFFSLFPSS